MSEPKKQTKQGECLTFWGNWFDGVDLFPDDMRLAWYDAVMRYHFRNIEPPRPSPDDPLSAIRWNAVQMVRATILISKKRRLNGQKGGMAKRKQSESKAEANAKQIGSKREAKRKQEQEQVQDKEQEQEQDAKCLSATTPRAQRPTLKQLISQAKLAGIDAAFAEEQWYILEADGWRDKNGAPIASAIRYLKTAWLGEQKKICAARENPDRGGVFGSGIPVARRRKGAN